MFKLFKAGIEYNNLAKNMNGMNIMIQELILQMHNSRHSDDDFGETILVLAYIARVGVQDRLEKFNWPLSGYISVPSIQSGRITLAYAIQQTVGKMYMIGNELNMSEEIEGIMERSSIFYEFEKILPENLKKGI